MPRFHIKKPVESAPMTSGGEWSNDLKSLTERNNVRNGQTATKVRYVIGSGIDRTTVRPAVLRVFRTCMCAQFDVYRTMVISTLVICSLVRDGFFGKPFFLCDVCSPACVLSACVRFAFFHCFPPFNVEAGAFCCCCCCCYTHRHTVRYFYIAIFQIQIWLRIFVTKKRSRTRTRKINAEKKLLPPSFAVPPFHFDFSLTNCCIN